MVEYVYNAWGKHKALVLDSTGSVMVEWDKQPKDENDPAPNPLYQELSQLNPFRYRGYYFDTETGLYFLKTRYYDPEICRFITIDDLSYLDPETINGLNLYAYCGNNPVMCVDPNGTLKWWQNLLIGLGIIVGAALLATAITFTGGGAAAFFLTVGKAVLGGLKIAAVTGAVAGVFRAGKVAILGGTIDEVGQSLILGFSDGFLAGSIYAGSTMLLSACAFRISGKINNGFGWSFGRFEGGYQTPQTPGISIVTYNGGVNYGRTFGLDIDIFNGLHYHTNKYGFGKRKKWLKTHHWMMVPIIIGIGVGLSNGWSEW